MTLFYKNNAYSQLAVAIGAGALILTLPTGEGARFPALGGGDTFDVTVEDLQAGTREIMLCTARAGDVLTVTRAQEGTVAQAFAIGAVVENRLTAGRISAFQTKNTNIDLPVGGTIKWGSTDFTVTHLAGGQLTFNGGASGKVLMNDGTINHRIALFSGGQVFMGTFSNHQVNMQANNATIQSWTGTGTTISTALTLSAGQIVFPGTANPSGGANTFDDYEEGSWTPVTTPNGGTITTMGSQTGWYRKLAGLLTGGLNINCTTNGTGSVSLNIAGLPFTPNPGCAAVGRETAVNGKAVTGNIIAATTAIAAVVFYDNTYPFSNGAQIVLNFAYPCT